jgi:DNA-binding NtrC family response regulator
MTPQRAGHVLVASPNRATRQRILATMSSPFCRVQEAAGGAEALGQLESGFWEVLFLDRRLPDLNAEELSSVIRQRFPETEVVLMDPENETELEPRPSEAIESIDEPPMPERALAKSAEPAPVDSLPGMIGAARSLQPIYRAARLVARRDTTVLITGPTGSGKEMVARAIHDLSSRANRNFVVVNCAAIPESLLESELFGYTRGAFTGATQSYGGRIQAAQGGTLFLDEIGEMPLNLQPKLLRFLERKEVQRLGSSDPLRVDARIVAATNVHLPTLVAQNRFRADLYFRLATFPMELPSLAERHEDLVPLAEYFLEKMSPQPPAPRLSRDAIRLLHAHSWAGNVRELQNVMERAMILSGGDECDPAYGERGETAAAERIIRPEHLLLNERTVVN